MSELPRDPIKARMFKAAGWIAIVIAFAVSLALTPLVGAIPLFIGYLLFREGKKYSVKGGETVMQVDGRPPVLYLRSFNDETEDRSLPKYFKSGALSSQRDLARTVPPSGLREQDALGFVFRKVGPYIALGKPGEKLPELGSSKIYVPNESWQAEIRKYFSSSRLIIFRAGKTEGLKWELEQMVQMVNPRKVVMIVPATDEDYAGFIQWANRILPERLPLDFPSSRIIVFDEKWKPSYLKPGMTLTDSFSPFLRQNGISVKETFWEKFLEHNGIRW
jgi:hypothetical protein